MGDKTNVQIVTIARRDTSSIEEWTTQWIKATDPDEGDTETKQGYFQFRACIHAPSVNTYLCVHSDGSVCIDGHQDQPNTVFRVIHVYPPNKNYYQITCHGGRCHNYVLYVEGTTLKARPYCDGTDSLDGGHRQPSETLFRFPPDHNGTIYIHTLNEELKFSHSGVNGPNNSNILLTRQQSDDVISFEETIVEVHTTV